MTHTVFGVLLDKLGQARQVDVKMNRHGYFEQRARCWATPSSGLRTRQAAHIPVDISHNKELVVGEVVHLERDKHENAWAVAHVDFDPPEGVPLWWSPALTFNRDDGGDVEVTALAITPRPAQTGIRHLPLTFLEGKVDYRGCTKRWSLEPNRRQLLERAAAAYVLERGQPIYVREPERNLDGLSEAEKYVMLNEQYDEQYEQARMQNKLMIRPCGPILSVR